MPAADTPADGLPPARSRPRRVLVLGASGTIGRATLRELLRRGHDAVGFVRDAGTCRTASAPPGERDAPFRFGDVRDPASVSRDGLRGEHFDAVISCLASRTGVPADAWAIDDLAQRHALAAARQAGVGHFVLLSAICVQKPRLAFQHAKLAFEGALAQSGVPYTIVRPTAFFKSLSGQVERVRQGHPFLLFGDGTLTACKPVADEDLAAYLADCLDDPARRGRVLPIGGPGAAITPRDQGEALFALLGRKPRWRQVPVALLDAVAAGLGAAGRLVPALAAKAELARIGRYYATESMLAWDPVTGRYDADATPSTGQRTLFDHYAALVRGEVRHERGDHAVF